MLATYFKNMTKNLSSISIPCKPASQGAPLNIEKEFQCPPPGSLEVDLGCGKGRFLLARANAHKDTCFLGIDRRRRRIEKIGRAVERNGLENIRLVCAEAFFTVTSLIPENSVSTYYIFFPDPWPKRRHHRRRLFDANFLDAIQRTLRANGKIHIATDHPDYFSIIREALTADPRFAEIDPFVPAVDERTNFELVFMAQKKPIGRCSFMKISPKI